MPSWILHLWSWYCYVLLCLVLLAFLPQKVTTLVGVWLDSSRIDSLSLAIIIFELPSYGKPLAQGLFRIKHSISSFFLVWGNLPNSRFTSLPLAMLVPRYAYRFLFYLFTSMSLCKVCKSICVLDLSSLVHLILHFFLSKCLRRFHLHLSSSDIFPCLRLVWNMHLIRAWQIACKVWYFKFTFHQANISKSEV